MEKLQKTALGIIYSLSLAGLVTACSTQNDVIEELGGGIGKNELHTCKLTLDASKMGFTDEPESRAEETSVWAENDKIYLTFTTDETTVYGDAIYNGTEWTINYYGTIVDGTADKCVAVYFENPESTSGTLVTVNENTIIYEDVNGSFTYNEGTLSVTADLKPKTGRIRFAGKNNTDVTAYGISHYTTYDFSTCKYTSTNTAVSKKVSSGYTPYTYGFFTDSEEPRLSLITGESAFTILPSNTIFKGGESGYMTIPTIAAHNGWQNAAIFKINGVELTMLPVVRENALYLLAETELTRAQYNAVIPGSFTSELNLPVTNSSDTYLQKLNALTGLTFRIPTEAEWTFAAKGGDLTHNYTYAGSNNIADVAWYSANSESKLHPVKQLQPNELGFYDMSGNVWEQVYRGSSIYYFGGDCVSGETSCTTTNYVGSYSTNYRGCRLALSVNDNK